MLLDPENFPELFLPDEVPYNFKSLAIKTLVVATNYLDRSEIVHGSWALKPAVAGSVAIPGFFRPVSASPAIIARRIGAIN